jgi:hypothetical protein
MRQRRTRRRIARAGVWLACCLASTWGCGSGTSPPTAPTPPAIDLSRTDTPLELSSERYLLQLIGNDLSDDPALPACSPILVPRGGKLVTTFLWFGWEGDELVGRSRPPYAATLEIRLRRVSSSILGVAVGGTVTGAAPDEYDRILGRRDTTFSAEGGSVALSGLVSPRIRDDALGPTLSGWMRGPIAFRDAAGAVSLCTNAQYYLEPARPGGPHDDPTVPPFVPAHRLPGPIGAVAPRNGAGAPTPRRSGSADERIQRDSIDVFASVAIGTAVALREAVTDR